MSLRRQVLSYAILFGMLLSCAQPTFAQRSFTEDFTTTTYRDAANTTAVWDTGDGTLHLPAFTPLIIGTGTAVVDAWEVEIVGDLAFVADGVSGLRILDITDPTNPVQVGVIDTAVSVHDLTVDGDLAYLADGPSGMLIIDISNPATPTLLGTYNSPGAVRDIVLSGDYAILADDSAGIRVVDVSNPSSPVLVGFVDPPGIARGLAIAGNHVFVANGSFSFLVIDITNPTNPVEVGSTTTLDNAVDVVIDGDYAYVADGAMGVSVIDITIPGLPILRITQNTGDYARGIDVDGDYLYVADGTAGLRILDISNPLFPGLSFNVNTPGPAFGVAVDGGLAYVADGASGLQVVRVAHLTGLGVARRVSLPENAEGVAVSGNHLVMADGASGIRILDITDPELPVEVGSVNPPGVARDVAIDGNYVYLANGYLQFRVIDISNPTSPVEVGFVSTGDTAQGVEVRGDYAYVADGFWGIRVIDISDPTNPTFAGFRDTPGYTRGIAVSGDHAYLADGPSGLYVVDISIPSTPVLVGSVGTPGDANDVAIAGDRAFVADWDSGLRIIDISNPLLPVEIASITGTMSNVTDVTVTGNYVFLVGTNPSFAVYDITDPSNPRDVSYLLYNGTGRGLALAGDYAFLSLADSRLEVRKLWQRECDPVLNTGQSSDVALLSEDFLKFRLTSTATFRDSWDFSTDSGASWQPVSPNGIWTTPASGWIAGLRWRATLFYVWDDPMVSAVTLEWLIDAPLVNSAFDIPNDQGRQVRVEWARSGHDFLGDAQQITEYAVYRQIEPGLKRDLIAAAGGERAAGVDLTGLSIAAQDHALLMAQAGWDFITTVPVRVEDYYAVVAPTLSDSTIGGGQSLSTFMVSALTATPGVYFDSDPVSGYSVDNLAPGVPKNIVAGYAQAGTQLDWDDPLEEDFQLFRVYRDTSPGFTPSAQNLVQELASSMWLDASPDPWGLHYKITAVDHAGNESPVGIPSIITDSPSGRPSSVYALHEAMPNPFNPSTLLRFNVPGNAAAQTRLEIFDSVGRLVVQLVNEPRAPGEYSVRWTGVDGTGSRVVSGVYFARLQVAGHPDLTRKMALVK